MNVPIKPLIASVVLVPLLGIMLFQAARPAQVVRLTNPPVVPMTADCGKLPHFAADEPLNFRLRREECRSKAAADAYANAWRHTLGE